MFLKSDSRSKLSSDTQSAYLFNNLGLYCRDLGHLDDAKQFYEAGVQIRRQQRNEEYLALGLRNLANLCILQGDLSRALEYTNEVQPRSREGVRLREAFIGYISLLKGELETALRYLEQFGDRERPRDGAGNTLFYPELWRAETHLRLGRLDVAETIVRQALREASADEYHLDKARFSLQLARIAGQRGNIQSGMELSQEVRRWAVDRGAKEVLCWERKVQALLQLERNQFESASGSAKAVVLPTVEAYIEEGLRVAMGCGYGLHCIDLLNLRARVRLLMKDRDKAICCAREAINGIDSDLSEGRKLVRGAVDQSCGYAWGECEARFVLAQALLLSEEQSPSQEERAEARNELDRCLELCARTHNPMENRVRRVLESRSSWSHNEE